MGRCHNRKHNNRKQLEVTENKNNNKQKPNLGNFKPGGKAPRFNPYWIYGIVIVVFLAIQYFSFDGGPVKTNWTEIKNEMLQQNDIERIVIVNNNEAMIYLKETSYEKYVDKLNKGFAPPAKYGPHFSHEIGSVETFVKNIEEAQLNFSESDKISIEFETKTSYLGELFSWSLPIIFILLFLAFVRFISRNIVRSKNAKQREQ